MILVAAPGPECSHYQVNPPSAQKVSIPVTRNWLICRYTRSDLDANIYFDLFGVV